MSKKSAKSKGYRKAVEKKPYLSRKDIIILCVVLAVLAVGAILLFTYDDGALKVKDGKIVDPGENWLIVNGNTKGGRRYFKLGEVGDIPGYTLSPEPFVSDDNLTQFKYTPEAEDSAVTGIVISASAYDPERLSEGNARMVAGVKGTAVSDIATDRAGDVEYTYYTYTQAYTAEEEADAAEEAPAEESAEAEAPAEDAEAEAPAEEAPAGEKVGDEAPNRFEQALNAYVPAPNNGSIVIVISAKADSADGYRPEDQLKETLGQAITAVTLESKQK